MQYNTHATDQDCITEVLQICNAVVNNYSLVDITRRFNTGLDRYFSLAFESDGRWNFDDINEASPPIDTQNIVSGTNRYKVGTFTEKVLSVIKIELLNDDAKTLHIEVDTMEDLVNRGDDFNDVYVNAPAGTPTKYIKYGNFIYFNAKPNWSEADGLLIYFNRPASYMASTDTTKVPGVPGIHHTYLCRMASLPYLIENNMSQAGGISQQIQADELSIIKFFSRRTKDTKQTLIPNIENCK